MEIKDVTEKRENSIEVFGVLIMIIGLLGGLSGIFWGISNENYMISIYGAVGLFTSYLLYIGLMTLAENHCMLRHISNIEEKKEEEKRRQKEMEDKNEKDLQKIIDAYNK